MRIAIYTLCSNNNFGNKLQNYALLKAIKQYNKECYTVWIENPNVYTNIRQLMRYIKHCIYDRFNKRNKCFKKFNQNLNVYKKKMIFNNSYKKIQKDFDMIIVGSDQVWNPNFSNNKNIFYLSTYNGIKVSYAASFGISNFDNEYVENYLTLIKKFNYISVRENEGKEILSKNNNREDIKVLIDPTMLLSKEEWSKIEKKPNIKSRKYILNYFLGDLSESRKKEIEKIAKKNECDIINIMDKNDSLHNIGPEEFIYLEKNAFLICTDSYHSSVFAIIFDRPFVIFEREQKQVKNMNSRINTLLDNLELKNRKYNGKNITKNNINHDYTNAYKILEEKRKEAFDFIKNSINN